MLPNPDSAQVKLADYLAIIRKRLFVILAFLIIVPSITTINVNKIKPVYRATVSIIIERVIPRVTKFEDAQQTTGMRDAQYYQTQYSILGSRSLAEKVFEGLALASDPEYQHVENPVEKLVSQIKVEPVKSSQVVFIHVEDTDALRASAIANALAKTYIRQDVETRNVVAKDAVVWLEKQLADVQKRMQDSEEALNEYVQENKIVTVPDIEKRTDTLLESLKRERATAETDMAELLKRYKSKHPKVIALNAQISDQKTKMRRETQRLLELNNKMVRYNILKKEAESNQQLYTSILTRAKETDISEKLQLVTIRIVDSAKPPRYPIRPLKSREIGRSFFLALLYGFSLAFLLEYLDSSIRTAEDVRCYIDLPFLGYISNADKEARTEADKSLICSNKPKCPLAEAYRAIRTSILFSSPEDKPLKSVLVTSSLPQEGKTFISTNLATIFAQLNERVVLVDIDMRRPKVSRALKIDDKAGLSDYLTGNLAVDDILRPSAIQNLTVIPAGTIPPNPSELLSSKKVKKLFSELKSRYDRIILDAPPLLSVSDASLLVNIVDGTIFVIRGARTRLNSIMQAKAKLAEAKGKIIGVILNDIEPRKEDRYYYYHYYYNEKGGEKAIK